MGEITAVEAREIANSDPVIRTYAAPEWEELSEDGQEWVLAIIRETVRRYGSAPAGTTIQ